MSENPRRTRRARRVSIESFDAMRAGNTARATLPEDEVLVAEDQTTLPLEPPPNGTADGHGNDLEVPYEAMFQSKDFLPAPGLRRVAQTLIHRDQSLRHLIDVRVEFLWKRKGGTRRGVPNIGDCVMPAGLARHAWNAMARAMTGSSSEAVVYVVWLASDHLETYTPLQVEASLYRQLCRTGLRTSAARRNAPDGSSAFCIVAPDFQGFTREIMRFGLWNASLVQAAPVFSQAQSQGQTGDDPWGASPMETTLNHEPVETTGEEHSNGR